MAVPHPRGTDVHPAATLSGIDPERLRVAYAAEAGFDFQRSHVGRPETDGLCYRLQRPVANLVKRGARRYGFLTSSRRAAPDFLLIGAKRAGSTTLYRGLVDSGDIASMFPAREQRKGVYYFDVHHARGDKWYLGHMPLARSARGQKVGEASPYYLSHPHAAARAAALVPEARIVVVLRDPIERAHSHYRERWRQGVEYLPTFDEAIAAEAGRLDGELEAMIENPRYVSWNHLNFGYLEQSRYATNLRRWYDAYPAKQILVLRAEDLYADPAATIDEVRDFIGLGPAGPVDVTHHNKLEPGQFSPETAAHLRDALAPEVRELEAMVGRPLGWPTR